MSLEQLEPLDRRLSKRTMGNWKRSDVVGVCMAAYALLLRSTASDLTSPRSSNSVIDVRRSWREGMVAAREFKSFTFLRWSMLPALQMTVENGADVCNICEFWVSVLADFGATYLASIADNRPISQKEWLQEAQEDLNLRRQRNDQDKKFLEWSNTTTNEPMEEIPNSVDLSQRPDCMDDVLACCTAIATLGPEYAAQFWTMTDQANIDTGKVQTSWVPSRVLSSLRAQQQVDQSLRSAYLAFMAAIATAQREESLDAAEIIHQFVEVDPLDRWQVIFKKLRTYARRLSPHNDQNRDSVTLEDNHRSSSQYYYFDRDSAVPSKSKTSSTDKSFVLDIESLLSLRSHLKLVANVAGQSEKARLCMLKLNLADGGTTTTGSGSYSTSNSDMSDDTPLMILFNLAVAPLTPEFRGLVFQTIASLLLLNGVTTPEDLAVVHEAASKAWELLEAWQLVPIYLLEQYPSPAAASIRLGVAFPPTSSSLVRMNRILFLFLEEFADSALPSIV